jgi:hypothetical protein
MEDTILGSDAWSVLIFSENRFSTSRNFAENWTVLVRVMANTFYFFCSY